MEILKRLQVSLPTLIFVSYSLNIFLENGGNFSDFAIFFCVKCYNKINCFPCLPALNVWLGIGTTFCLGVYTKENRNSLFDQIAVLIICKLFFRT